MEDYDIPGRLFDRRRDLFTDLSAVFMDTTSLSVCGEGCETLGEHGYSKDYRPNLKQMILGLVVDGDGRPICTEMWPGDTAEVTTLLPVVVTEWKGLLRDLDRLQQARIRHRGADWLVRTDAAPSVTSLFKSARVALPPRAR